MSRFLSCFSLFFHVLQFNFYSAISNLLIPPSDYLISDKLFSFRNLIWVFLCLLPLLHMPCLPPSPFPLSRPSLTPLVGQALLLGARETKRGVQNCGISSRSAPDHRLLPIIHTQYPPPFCGQSPRGVCGARRGFPCSSAAQLGGSAFNVCRGNRKLPVSWAFWELR